MTYSLYTAMCIYGHAQYQFQPLEFYQTRSLSTHLLRLFFHLLSPWWECSFLDTNAFLLQEEAAKTEFVNRRLNGSHRNCLNNPVLVSYLTLTKHGLRKRLKTTKQIAMLKLSMCDQDYNLMYEIKILYNIFVQNGGYCATKSG